MAVEFGIPIPQVFLDGRADMELVRDSLVRAEELGFHSAWTQDQVTGEASLLECMGLMTYAAACTSRMRLGVSVIVFPIRNPVQLAKSVSSLDHMSNGRVTLGIGLGPPANAANFYRSFGVEYAERVRRFNEGLAVMKALWTEAEVHMDGEFWHLDGTAMEPKPVQQPHPPVIFGGQHPNALKRAAAHADGYMGAGPTPTRSFISHVEKLREYLLDAGRDPASFPVSKRVYLHVDNDAAKAKAVLDNFFGARYPWMIKSNPDFVADICVWGSPQQCADGLAQVIKGGAGMIVLNPIRDFVAQFERLADEVVPLLR
ncbi:MAG: LLM class flavin-dependent oxidoreductase [Gammaproteobacteria bacterium]|jgi:probable F420-dependent oxidoreductase|nr:LLM class flavin-dependent oxidoreductase [Gammaproteobacteria bacterium]MDP6617731.1 LLM class flavin-dependent oxidoreductase [Gammaproteobacteria bacterium]MDP6694117.1 LLM class flavin-dependent oxidoreductase [Gammaproteobacteria bacterium]